MQGIQPSLARSQRRRFGEHAVAESGDIAADGLFRGCAAAFGLLQHFDHIVPDAFLLVGADGRGTDAAGDLVKHSGRSRCEFFVQLPVQPTELAGAFAHGDPPFLIKRGIQQAVDTEEHNGQCNNRRGGQLEQHGAERIMEK